MAKLMKNKKLFVTLLAGILLLTAVIGTGTYAWFTDSATIGGNADFKTAIVALDDADGDYDVYTFDANIGNIDIQKGLEKLVDGSDSPWALMQTYINYNLWNDYATDNYPVGGWWDLVGPAAWGVVNGLCPEYTYMELFAAAQPGQLAKWQAEGTAYNVGVVDAIFYAIKNANLTKGDVKKVVPGSLIYGDFTLENKSNVDTYFRVERPVQNNNGISMWGIDVRGNDPLVDYEMIEIDGYWYSPIRLAPGAEINITIGVYVYGEANGNDVQDTEFDLGALEVELIQADNNAAVLAGWAPAYNFYR